MVDDRTPSKKQWYTIIKRVWYGIEGICTLNIEITIAPGR